MAKSKSAKSKRPVKKSGSKKTIFAIALALITVFFVAYVILFVYPSPEYTDFCDRVNKITVEIPNAEECESIGGEWIAWESPAPNGDIGYCDQFATCNAEYDEARQPYERNVFFINLFLGLAILIITFFLSVEAVSAGLMGGGALLMIYGTLRYWGNLSNGLRALFLGIALAILVYFGYKKLSD